MPHGSGGSQKTSLTVYRIRRYVQDSSASSVSRYVRILFCEAPGIVKSGAMVLQSFRLHCLEFRHGVDLKKSNLVGIAKLRSY